MRPRCKISLLLFILLWALPADAQFIMSPLYTSDANSARILAQTLAGPGITVLNASMTCPHQATSLFNGGNTNLGIDSGLVLSNGYAYSLASGTVAGVDGPQSMFSTYNFGVFYPVDQDLAAIFPNTSIHDPCTVEFDFVPIGDTVTFDYVFASEEYPGYSCSSYNDVFGFFITGPGYPTPKNIALIPGTGIPVCINSTTGVPGAGTHPGCTGMGAGAPFSQYYVDNTGGTTVTFDGFTKVLPVIAAVVPCQTYHLKLGVADVQDGQLNSAVFLKAGSFKSNGVTVNSVSGPGLSDSPEHYVVRDCQPGRFHFKRPSSHADPLVLHYAIRGTADNGVDYVRIPDSVVIPAYATEVDVMIQGLRAIPPDGPKTIKIYLYSPYPCIPATQFVDSAEMVIYDSLNIIIRNPDTIICLGGKVQLQATGDSLLHYSWSPATGLSDSSVLNPVAAPLASTAYVLTARSADTTCPAAHPALFIEVQPVPSVNIGADTFLCFNDTIQIRATVDPPGYGNYTYSWDPSGGFSNPSVPNTFYYAQAGTVATLAVRTPAGCQGSDRISIEVAPQHFIIASGDTGICPYDTVMLRTSGAIAYRWSPPYNISDISSSTPSVWPATTTIYNVSARSNKGCEDSVKIEVAVFPAATIQLPDTVTVFPGETVMLQPRGNCLYYFWFPSLGLSADNIANPLAGPPVNTRYQVLARTEQGCTVTDTVDVLANTDVLLTVPNAFSPGSSPNGELRIIRRGAASLKYFRVFDRWGKLVFETRDIDQGWNGLFNSLQQPMGVYVYSIEAVTKTGVVFKKNGNVTLLR